MVAGVLAFGSPSMSETPAEKDLRLYKTWVNARGIARQRAAAELLDVLTGPIMTAVNAFNGASLPMPTVQVEAKRFALEALEAYKPGYGTSSLSTYVTTAVKQKLYRYVATYQNPARIPEGLIQKVSPFKDAVSELSQQFGREPTTVEIADHLGITTDKVSRLRKLVRKSLFESGPGSLDDLEHYQTDPAFEKCMLAYYSMTPDEQHVFDYSLGAHGQPRLSNNDIAAKLKLSAGRISQIKKAIADKLEPYLKGS